MRKRYLFFYIAFGFCVAGSAVSFRDKEILDGIICALLALACIPCMLKLLRK